MVVSLKLRNKRKELRPNSMCKSLYINKREQNIIGGGEAATK